MVLLCCPSKEQPSMALAVVAGDRRRCRRSLSQQSAIRSCRQEEGVTMWSSLVRRTRSCTRPFPSLVPGGVEREERRGEGNKASW